MFEIDGLRRVFSLYDHRKIGEQFLKARFSLCSKDDCQKTFVVKLEFS